MEASLAFYRGQFDYVKIGFLTAHRPATSWMRAAEQEASTNRQLDRNGNDTTEARSPLIVMLNAQALDVRDRDLMVAELKDQKRVSSPAAPIHTSVSPCFCW